MTLEVSVATRTLDINSGAVTTYALVTLGGQPVKNLRQRHFSLYVPARDDIVRGDASVWGQGFGFVDLETSIRESAIPGFPSAVGLAGVYELQLTSDGTDITGQPAWVPGWHT